MMIPGLGIIDSFGGYTAEYYNAFGFFILRKRNILSIQSLTNTMTVWAVLNIFFLIASVRLYVKSSFLLCLSLN